LYLVNCFDLQLPLYAKGLDQLTSAPAAEGTLNSPCSGKQHAKSILVMLLCAQGTELATRKRRSPLGLDTNDDPQILGAAELLLSTIQSIMFEPNAGQRTANKTLNFHGCKTATSLLGCHNSANAAHAERAIQNLNFASSVMLSGQPTLICVLFRFQLCNNALLTPLAVAAEALLNLSSRTALTKLLCFVLANDLQAIQESANLTLNRNAGEDLPFHLRLSDRHELLLLLRTANT
jgi:hypothetical protein